MNNYWLNKNNKVDLMEEMAAVNLDLRIDWHNYFTSQNVKKWQAIDKIVQKAKSAGKILCIAGLELTEKQVMELTPQWEEISYNYQTGSVIISH